MSSIAIDCLRGDDPDEAYFAPRRLLARHGIAVAADLMLEIDRKRGGRELIERYCDAKLSLRLEIERRLRVQLVGEGLATLIAPFASLPRARDRIVAARLAAVIPPAVPLPWLEAFVADASPDAQEVARDAVRKCGLESAAMMHRERLMSSPKPLQWARLSTIMELVDPLFLWSREDPANLKVIFDTPPFEFLDEAREIRKRQLKKQGNAPKKADKDH